MNRFVKSFNEFLFENERNAAEIKKEIISTLDNINSEKFLIKLEKRVKSYIGKDEDYNAFIERLEKILRDKITDKEAKKVQVEIKESDPDTNKATENINPERKGAMVKTVIEAAINHNLVQFLYNYLCKENAHFSFDNAKEDVNYGIIIDELRSFLKNENSEKKLTTPMPIDEKEFKEFCNDLNSESFQRNSITIGKGEVLLNLFLNNENGGSGDCFGKVAGYNDDVEIEVKGPQGSLSGTDHSFYKEKFDKEGNENILNIFKRVKGDRGNFIKDLEIQDFIKTLFDENGNLKNNEYEFFNCFKVKEVDFNSISNNKNYFKAFISYPFLDFYLRGGNKNKVIVAFDKNYNKYILIKNTITFNQFAKLVTDGFLTLSFSFGTFDENQARSWAPKITYNPNKNSTSAS